MNKSPPPNFSAHRDNSRISHIRADKWMPLKYISFVLSPPSTSPIHQKGAHHWSSLTPPSASSSLVSRATVSGWRKRANRVRAQHLYPRPSLPVCVCAYKKPLSTRFHSALSSLLRCRREATGPPRKNEKKKGGDPRVTLGGISLTFASCHPSTPLSPSSLPLSLP